VGGLRISADAKLTFAQAGKMWLEADKHALSTSPVKRREMHIKGLLPYFQDIPIRNVTDQDCDRWVAGPGRPNATRGQKSSEALPTKAATPP
jgi:hypothetical protein